MRRYLVEHHVGPLQFVASVVGTLAIAPRGALSTLPKRFGETQLLYTYRMQHFKAPLTERSAP